MWNKSRTKYLYIYTKQLGIFRKMLKSPSLGIEIKRGLQYNKASKNKILFQLHIYVQKIMMCRKKCRYKKYEK